MKRRILKYNVLFILISIILAYSSCIRNNSYDKKDILVINDVFKELTDSIVMSPIYPVQFTTPPMQILKDAKGKIPNYLETAEFYKKKWEDYKKLLKIIDTNRNVISVSDTLLSSDMNVTYFVSYMRKVTAYHNYFEVFDSYIANKKQPLYLDINELKYKGKYELITRSSITTESGKLKTIFPYYYYGNLTLTRVYFDKNERYAFFAGDLDCGHYYFEAFLVLLIHNKSGWIIDRLIQIG